MSTQTPQDITEVIEQITGEDAPEDWECFTEIEPVEINELDFDDNVLAARNGAEVLIGYVSWDPMSGGGW